MRSPRLILAATVLATLAVPGATAAGWAAGSGPAAGGKAAPCGGRVSSDGSRWSELRPHFPAGTQQVQQAVATPFLPDRVYVTNGASVLRSDDGGCTWTTFVGTDPGGRLGLLPEPLDGILTIPTTMHIAAIAAPSSATATDRVYVALNDTSALTTQPRVEAFDGSRWHLAQGLPRFGTIREIAANDSVATTVFALIDPANRFSTDAGLYASSDGGATFTQRDATATPSTLRELRADPLLPSLVYGLDAAGLRASRDGGLNFAHAGPPAPDSTSYDVASAQGTVQFVLGHSHQARYDRGLNGGLTFSPVRAPIAAKQVAVQPISGLAAVADGRRLFLEPHDELGQARDITPRHGALGQLQFTAPLGAGYALYGVRGGALLRGVFTLTNELVAAAPGGRPVLLLPHPVPHQFPSTLTPGRSRLHIRPGGHRDVAYRLLLPRTPSPVDVMFLVDTSSSTTPTIDGLKQDLGSIVNDLAGVGLDAEFGVADFKDYPPRIGGIGDGDPHDYPYRLDRVIGPADASLQAALNELHAKGGGDPAESQLTALYQSTTGAGQRYPGRHSYIPGLQPGQDARYRPESLRLAVLATDDHFHTGRHYLTPSWDSTVAALRSHHVYPIGLALRSFDGDYKSRGFRSFAIEQRLAAATGSFAPAGGVDCNGDLVPDVASGAPFVCKVAATVTRAVSVGPLQTKAHVLPVRLGPAITRAAETLPDVKPVGLDFSGTGRHLARLVAPQQLPRVNLKNDNTLSFTVRYSCPKAAKPHAYGIGIHADTGVRVVASSAMQLACGAVPPPASHLPPPAAAVAVAAPAAVAPAPPAPGNPVPNPNPNPNPAINANVGFASQEEEQRQLAFAGADAGADPDLAGETAMSRLGRTSNLQMSRLGRAADATSATDGDGSDLSLWLFGAAALTLTAAAGCVARARARTATQTATWHRR